MSLSLSPKDILDADDDFVVGKTDVVGDHTSSVSSSESSHQQSSPVAHHPAMSAQRRSLVASKYFDESAQMVRQASLNTLVSKHERQEDRRVLFSLANDTHRMDTVSSVSSTTYGLAESSEHEVDSHVAAIWLDLHHTWHTLSPILEPELLPSAHHSEKQLQPPSSKFTLHKPNDHVRSTRPSAAFHCSQLDPLQRTAGLDDGG